ncbi:MAG: hypothetical protein QOD93_7434 [Acetobacteraceae bacterium]|nr:hypothetical protein [Acetobacteraceae bacterium]
MQDEYPAEGGVRLRRARGGGQTVLGSGRVFACMRCGCQIVVCSCCDRGQIYCNGDCSGHARRQTLHRAGRRWQRTSQGRRMHDARMARYRAKLAKGSDGVGVGMPAEGWPREIVTHHVSPAPPADDLLAGGATAMPHDDAPRPSRPGGQRRTATGAVVSACCRFAAGSCVVAITVAAVLARPGRSANRHRDRDGGCSADAGRHDGAHCPR